MAKTPKPEPPKRRNPLARVVTQIHQQVIPNKKKRQQPKHRPNHLGDWADSVLAVCEFALFTKDHYSSLAIAITPRSNAKILYGDAMSLLVSRFHVNGFKSINSAEINLDRINVLVGPNNAGKTSILQAIQFATSLAQTAGELKVNNFPQGSLNYLPIAGEFTTLKHGTTLTEGSNIMFEFSESDGCSRMDHTSIVLTRGRNGVISITKP